MSDLENVKCIDVKQLTYLLNISRVHAYKLVNQDSFYPAFRLGRRWLINTKKLEQWVDEQSKN